MHLNMVRPELLYMVYIHLQRLEGKINLKPAMTLKANIILVKDVEKDTS